MKLQSFQLNKKNLSLFPDLNRSRADILHFEASYKVIGNGWLLKDF